MCVDVSRLVQNKSLPVLAVVPFTYVDPKIINTHVHQPIKMPRLCHMCVQRYQYT